MPFLVCGAFSCNGQNVARYPEKTQLSSNILPVSEISSSLFTRIAIYPIYIIPLTHIHSLKTQSAAMQAFLYKILSSKEENVLNQQWINAREQEYLSDIKRVFSKTKDVLYAADFLDDEEKAELAERLDRMFKTPDMFDTPNNYQFYSEVSLKLELASVPVFFHPGKNDSRERAMRLRELLYTVDFVKIAAWIRYGQQRFAQYLDSKPMQFEGNLLITDPCYVMRLDSDWERCNYGSRMEVLGIAHYMTRDTIFGDWSCTVFDMASDNPKPLGKFCADSGLVSVFLLDEVKKYNPSFDYPETRPWTATVIRDFKGTVQFVVELEEGYYEEDSEFWSKGDHWEDFSVHVIGRGVNTKTGEPIIFRSSQTGL